jgi:outer membrane lipoprotein-sorting protein
MTHENRERGGPESAALSTDAPLTPEDERIAEALAVGLASLRRARPGFQDALEQRLLDRLAEPARPWWSRALPARTGTGPQSAGVIRMPRRSFLGLAAASALVLAGASVALPLIGTPEVSAREILEKVQANSESPGLAGVKSFHLTAKIWSDPSRFGKEHAQKPGPREVMTEQWFVAPDRMRTESRANDSSGKTILSGMMSNGSDFKHYITEGAADAFLISVFTAPIGAKQVSGVHVTHNVREGGPATSPGPGAQHGAGVPAAGVRVAIATRKADGGEAKDVDEDVFVVGEGCAEPKRTGEATIAGRPVFVVENDFSACLPANAPPALKGRHVRWVDQKTFLPLKMERYDQGGDLVDRYEVTSIEYDVEIAARTFTELPPGTREQEVKHLPLPPSVENRMPENKPAP